MKNRDITPEEGMAIITRMIAATRRRMARNSGTPFLIWGYATVAAATAVWAALHLTHDPRWNLLWLAIPAVGMPLTLRLVRRNRAAAEATTYVDRIVSDIWRITGLVGFICSLTALFLARLPILYLIVTLMGSATALTGSVLRSRTVRNVGLASCILLAPPLLFVPGDAQILYFAAVFLVMMVIPGHILNRRNRTLR